MITNWWSVTSLALSVLAAPPVVQDAYFTTLKYEGSHFMVLKMDFDQWVYLKKASDNSIVAPSGMLARTRPDMPDLSYNGIGMKNLM
jgi:hypothetical protein